MSAGMLHVVNLNYIEMDDAYLPPPGLAYPSQTAYSNPQEALAPYPTPNSQTPPFTGFTFEPRRTNRSSDDRTGASFDDKNIRVAFLRKVYMTLAVQLLFTATVICVFLFVEPIQNFMGTKGEWFCISSIMFFVVTNIVLVCCHSVRRKYPYNYLALAIFTLAMTLMTATISSFANTVVILIAMAMAAGVCIAVSIFARQTKIDFTRSRCTLFGFLLLVTVFLVGIAVGLAYGINRDSSQFLNIVIGSSVALVIDLFFTYETQLLMKTPSLSKEEYIYGATQLYLCLIKC